MEEERGLSRVKGIGWCLGYCLIRTHGFKLVKSIYWDERRLLRSKTREAESPGPLLVSTSSAYCASARSTCRDFGFQEARPSILLSFSPSPPGPRGSVRRRPHAVTSSTAHSCPRKSPGRKPGLRLDAFPLLLSLLYVCSPSDLREGGIRVTEGRGEEAEPHPLRGLGLAPENTAGAHVTRGWIPPITSKQAHPAHLVPQPSLGFLPGFVFHLVIFAILIALISCPNPFKSFLNVFSETDLSLLRSLLRCLNRKGN